MDSAVFDHLLHFVTARFALRREKATAPSCACWFSKEVWMDEVAHRLSIHPKVLCAHRPSGVAKKYCISGCSRKCDLTQ